MALDQKERRRLLRQARAEGWSDEKRAEHGLGPARGSTGTVVAGTDAQGVRSSEPKKKKRKRKVDGGEGPIQNAEVIELYGERETPDVNKGGVVPPGGRIDGDRRVRKEVRFSRLGKRWSQIITEVAQGEYSWEEFVSTLSPEELARGQLKDVNGNFTGRPPTFVPRQFFDASIRELLNRGKILYKENYIACIKAMTQIAQSPGVKEGDRIKAATFVIERLEGKVPDKLEISAADPWQTIISGIVAEAEDGQVARAQEYLNRRGETSDGGA